MVQDWVDKSRTAEGVVSDFKNRISEVSQLSLLDAGCGNGLISIAFANAGSKVVGVEIEEELVEVARENAKVITNAPEFVFYDGQQLPFSDQYFDAVVSVSVLEHTSSPVLYLKEVFRVLKPDGSLYLAFPNKLWPKETHTGLFFLTYFPLTWRDFLVRLFNRNPLKDNNLHFYGYGDLVKMINEINVLDQGFTFSLVNEEGKNKNPVVLILKKVLGFFGGTYRAFLPHVMVVARKERKKVKVALMTYAMDNRNAKGSARYTRELVKNVLSDKRFDFSLVHYDRVDDPLYQQAKEILMPKINLPYGSRFISQMLFFWKYRNNQFDIVHWFQPRIYPFYWLAPARRIVVTAHGGGDITAPGLFVFSRRVFNFVLSRLNYWVGAIIGDSEFGRREIMQYYHFEARRAFNIWIGGAENFQPLSPEVSLREIHKKYGVDGPFILDVSRLQPHKNVYRLIQAYIKMRDIFDRKEKLVIVGAPFYDFESTYSLARESSYAKDIKFVDYVDEKDLNSFYSAAELFVFPSLNEGFGLPVVEAMASGVPVITSNTTSLPEITGGAGLLVDPLNVDDISKAMNSLLSDDKLRLSLISAGLDRAEIFSWSKMAEKTKELYLKIL